MLQEDFSHELCNLLCAYALTNCYKHTPLGKPAGDQGQQATEETKTEGEEEVLSSTQLYKAFSLVMVQKVILANQV